MRIWLLLVVRVAPPPKRYAFFGGGARGGGRGPGGLNYGLFTLYGCYEKGVRVMQT
jgi:hypothetical protein